MPAASNALVSLQDAIYIFSEPGLIQNDQSSRDTTGRSRSVDRNRSPGERSPRLGVPQSNTLSHDGARVFQNSISSRSKPKSNRVSRFLPVVMHSYLTEDL